MRSALCRYCCKSPKLPGANFLAVKKIRPTTGDSCALIAVPRSSASLSSGDEVPHIFTPKSRLKPGKFLIASAKDFCNNICHEPTYAVQQIWSLFEHLVGA